MIDHSDGAIDYDEQGCGPTVVLVPGSCSTGAAWRGVIAAWNGRYRCVTTSLLGYGGTAERRTPQDAALWREAEIVEAVVRRAGGPVHLVGHSFGGLVALDVALRWQVPLASVAIVEAPAADILRERGELAHYDAFRRMTAAYVADFDAGIADAVARMIDFYGGAGAWAAWPQKLRDYAMKTTPANVMDWICAYGFPLRPAALATIGVPVQVVVGGDSHVSVRRANEMLSEAVADAPPVAIDGARHFMIATHAERLAGILGRHIDRAEHERREREHARAACAGGSGGAARAIPA